METTQNAKLKPLIDHFPGGVIVIRNLLSRENAEDILCTVEDKILSDSLLELNNGRVFPGLFRHFPELKKLMEDDWLLNPVSAAIGCKPVEVRITDHSDYHINTLGGWHNDLGDHVGGYVDKKYRDAKIYKLGIFYSNKENQLGTLVTEFKVGKKLFRPRYEIGDILIFPIQIEHRGFPGSFMIRVMLWLSRRTILNNYGLWNRFVNLFRQWENKKCNRKAIFFTFGKRGAALDQFEERNITREKGQEGKC